VGLTITLVVATVGGYYIALLAHKTQLGAHNTHIMDSNEHLLNLKIDNKLFVLLLEVVLKFSVSSRHMATMVVNVVTY
jgi:hypothetical protein